MTRVSFAQDRPLQLIKLPPGFIINVFAEVPDARSLSVSPKGTVFVGNRSGDKVYALVDENKDGVADKTYVIAENLWSPNGVAFHEGDLYVAEINRVIRFPKIEENLEHPPQPIIVNDSFPKDTHHGWKFIRFGPDGKLYVPVGAPCNVCEKEDERYSSILRMEPNGLNVEVFAKGIRNTVGFDWRPVSNELWFTENGRDELGDNIPPDELNVAPQSGLHFGFPYCHGKNIIDPEFGAGKNCNDYIAPVQEMEAHVAALGMRFYNGITFPDEYRNQIFIAQHGSWNRSSKIGYQVMVVKLDGNKVISYEPFATGWMQGDQVWGRPVDIEILADGSMLVSDDYAGTVYRISYASAVKNK